MNKAQKTGLATQLILAARQAILQVDALCESVALLTGADVDHIKNRIYELEEISINSTVQAEDVAAYLFTKEAK